MRDAGVEAKRFLVVPFDMDMVETNVYNTCLGILVEDEIVDGCHTNLLCNSSLRVYCDVLCSRGRLNGVAYQ